MDPTQTALPPSLPSRLLLVADWELDPHAVVAAARDAARRSDARSFGVLVPAWLHGLDWAGDPSASVPCAQRQLATIVDLAARAGLQVDWAGAGDPDPAAAVGDALADWPANAVGLLVRPHRLPFSHPLDLEHRVKRLSGLPVSSFPVRRPASARLRRGRGFGGGHCVAQT